MKHEDIPLCRDHGWHLVHVFSGGWYLERPNPKRRTQRVAVHLLSPLSKATEEQALDVLNRETWRNAYRVKTLRRKPLRITFGSFDMPRVKAHFQSASNPRSQWCRLLRLMAVSTIATRNKTP